MTLSLVVKVRVTSSSFLASSVLEPRSGLVDELVDAKVSVSTRCHRVEFNRHQVSIGFGLSGFIQIINAQVTFFVSSMCP